MYRRLFTLALTCFSVGGLLHPCPTRGQMALDLTTAIKALEKAGAILKRYEDARQVLDAYEALTSADRAADAGMNPAGMPRIPSRCADSPACHDCFAMAQERITSIRVTLGKLRAIGLTTERFYEDSIALGDSLAGVPGGFGLGWHPERRKIQAGMEEFERSYDAKYRELMHSLREGLEMIATCEEEHFGESDWFDRYGFMYYSFMEAYYSR